MDWFSPPKTKWLVPDDPDGSWYCNCRKGIVDASWHRKEMAPYGGSGWLWPCVTCSRNFMFAKCVIIRPTLGKLARKRTPRNYKYMDGTGKIFKTTLLATPDDWLKLVQPIADSIAIGERYVFFDGHVFPAAHGPIKFDGLFRSHDLPDLPHLSETLTQETLANPAYWSGT
ncbi:hypothetical protein N9Y42_11195 [Mariniblastus sp.]|nr:hypothetical protein [Mariniblastus sp.]